MDTKNNERIERIDRTKSFKINRGIVQYLKLLPLFGEYENTLIWALIAEEYMHFESKSHRQVRVFTQYEKYKRMVNDVTNAMRNSDSVVANAVKSGSDDETAAASLYAALEEIFFVRLVVYEGDYTTAGIRGKSRVPGKLHTVYDGRVEEDQQRAVYIYRMYNGEWLPIDTSTAKSMDCMYVLILDHDVFISRFNTEAKSCDSITDEPRSWWKTEILELYDTEPDNRKIYWYWCKGVAASDEHREEQRRDEHRQNRGDDCKDMREFGKKLRKRYDDVIMCRGLESKRTVSKKAKGREPRMIICDMGGCPRIPYRAIESIKEGVFYTAEHDCEMRLYNPPHVIVFADCPPDRDDDRWIVKEIALQPGDE